MAISIGKHPVLMDAHSADGKPILAIWSEARTIYRRIDSYFWKVDGCRQTVTRRPDGSFYIKLIGGRPA